MALKDKLMTLEDFKAVRDVDVASNHAQFTEINESLDDVKADLSTLPVLTDDIKSKLITCFEHVAWADEHGAEYVKALRTALIMTYPILSVSFDSGDIVIYDDYALNDLRQFLSVRYYESPEVSYDITEYTLSGKLDSAKSQITVTYANMTKSVTIDVVVGRPLVSSDVVSHIGYIDFAISGGSVDYSDLNKYSVMALDPSIKHIRFTPSHNYTDTRLDISSWVASANLGEGAFICSDRIRIYKFTQDGGLYTASQDMTLATINTTDNWQSPDTDIRRRDVTLNDGTLKIVDADNPEIYKTITNANMIGFWSDARGSYKPQLIRVYND